MAAMTRRESEERQNGVRRFFMENPRATGEEAQRALTSGRLTARKDQPPMGLGMLVRVQREARAATLRGEQPPSHTPQIGVGGGGAATEEQFGALRERARELHAMLNSMPGTVLSIHITREGAHIVSLQPTEEKI
jgi:hypothetical protein